MSEEKKGTTTIIDLRGALLILERRGMKLSVQEALEKYGNGLTRTSVQNYDKEAPKAVRFIHDLCNDTGLTFEEIVKSV